MGGTLLTDSDIFHISLRKSNGPRTGCRRRPVPGARRFNLLIACFDLADLKNYSRFKWRWRF
jgi:hypothetical protein